MNRRRFISLTFVSLLLPGTHATPVLAEGPGNTRRLMKRVIARQEAKEDEENGKKEEKGEEEKEEKKSTN